MRSRPIFTVLDQVFVLSLQQLLICSQTDHALLVLVPKTSHCNQAILPVLVRKPFHRRLTTTRKTVNRSTLLLADTDGSSSSAGGLGMLTSDTKTPVVTKTTMGSDLLQTLQILPQLALHAVCQNL